MSEPSAANAEPVDVELKKPFKGQKPLALLITAAVLIGAVVIAVVVAMALPRDRNYNATADVTIGQVDRVPGQSPIAVPVTVVNTSDDERDFVVDVSAQSPDGATYYGTGGTLIERVPPGASGSGSVGFFGAEDIPMDAVFVVDSATGYKDCPNRSSGFC